MAASELSAAELTAVEDREILKVLERSCGLPIYSDGEFRRAAWSTAFADAVEGFVDSKARCELAVDFERGECV